MNPISFDDGKRLLQFFKDSEYDIETLREQLGINDISAFRLRKYILIRTRELTARNTLVRLFSGGFPVSLADAQVVFPDWVIEVCLEAGLLIQRDGAIEAAALMLPMGDVLIASDRVSKIEEDASDLVIWPNATTQQLLNGTIRRPVESALDLGCGTGVQAVVAAEYAKHVVATDLNPRAAQFTEFNARLNGVTNLECLTGDCFEPVGDRTFDLIVSNPPFFITRSSGIMYCENPLELDLFLRRLLREAPPHLNDGGFFQILCEWVELEGQPWRERLGGWLEGSGCDAWVLKTYTMAPLAYGKERCSQRPGGQAAADEALAEWYEYYQVKKIKAVHGGFITMRKRPGTNWVKMDDDPSVTLASSLSEALLAGFAAKDLIESSDDELLAAKLKVSPEVRLVQILKEDAAKWLRESLTLRVMAPFARELAMDPLVAEFAGKFDGSRTLGELIAELETKVNADRERVSRETLAITRKLLDRGFLTQV